MGKNVVKLNESQLNEIIVESVKRILKEDASVFQDRIMQAIQKINEAEELIRGVQGSRMQTMKVRTLFYNMETELQELYNEFNNPTVDEQKSIHINPENKGKFNATKERTGKSTEELTHSKNPLTRKRAIFAQNAKKWNKK